MVTGSKADVTTGLQLGDWQLEKTLQQAYSLVTGSKADVTTGLQLGDWQLEKTL